MKKKDLKFQILEERIEHEREVRELSDEFVEQARVLQAAEYQRRLDVLNHAHEQAVQAARATVPRETFDRYTETEATKATTRDDIIDKKLADFDSWRSGINGRTIGVGAAVAIAVIVINIIFRLIGQ